MTCGEGGAICVKNADVAERVANLIDCCGFYWTDREKSFDSFCASSARKSEMEGAMLLEQLKRLPRLIEDLRRKQKLFIETAAECQLRLIPMHSPEDECGLTVFYQAETADQAESIAEQAGAQVLGKTGRHTFTEWEPILNKIGNVHPLMDPFKMEANKHCRMNYTKDMLPQSRDILSRTLSFTMNDLQSDEDVRNKADRFVAICQEVCAFA